MESKKTGGIICTIIGAIGALYAIYTILEDTSGWIGYNYEPPLTDHEVKIIMILIGALALLLIGILCWVKASSQEKNTRTYTDAPLVTPTISNELKSEPPKSELPKQENKKTDAINEVMLYKELLDSGVLTQEEFDAKKKQLLGL